MEIINCTPHPIKLVNEAGEVVFSLPKGQVIPRLAQTTNKVSEINGIAITETMFGETQDLPEYNQDTILIVSRLVLTANRNRTDLVVPNELVRDSEGNIIGCKSLARN